MTLWLVTFDIDNTQFLVNAKNHSEAIDIANEHNKMLDEIEDYDFNGNYVIDYTVETVDFELLTEILKRDDIIFSTDKAIVFNG